MRQAITGFYLAMMLLTLIGCAGQRKGPATPQDWSDTQVRCDELQDRDERESCEWAEWYVTERNY